MHDQKNFSAPRRVRRDAQFLPQHIFDALGGDGQRGRVQPHEMALVASSGRWEKTDGCAAPVTMNWPEMLCVARASGCGNCARAAGENSSAKDRIAK